MTELELIERAGSEMARAGQAISDLAKETKKTRELVEQHHAEHQADIRRLELETERQAILQATMRGRFLAIPELERQGFRFAWEERGKVGQECSRISRLQFKDEPGGSRGREWQGVMCNTYLPAVLDEWIKQHGHRYTRVK